MMVCPKCGSSSIAGPKYENASAGGWFAKSVGNMTEWLRYTCIRCGYSSTSPTRDDKRAAIGGGLMDP